jgi:sugar phosphate isomerase/epimerase
VREVEKRLADSGLSLLDVEVFRLMPETQVPQFEAVLATAARLGASQILVHGADPESARLTQTFGQLCELCARYGLAANLEPMPWVDVSTVAKAMQILEGAAQPNAALLVDAIHFFRADNTLAELRRIAKTRLNYVQLCDAHPGRPAEVNELIRQARGDRLFPGEGALDLRGLLAAMPADLPLSLEIPIARKVEPFERVRSALSATQQFLKNL